MSNIVDNGNISIDTDGVKTCCKNIRKCLSDGTDEFNKIMKVFGEIRPEWGGKASRKAYNLLDEVNKLASNEYGKICGLVDYLSTFVVPSYENAEEVNQNLADNFL